MNDSIKLNNSSQKSSFEYPQFHKEIVLINFVSTITQVGSATLESGIPADWMVVKMIGSYISMHLHPVWGYEAHRNF